VVTGPEAIGSPGEHWSFPWWLFGILVSSPDSMGIGAVLGALLVWQRRRIQLWAWRARGRFR
jgi:NhaP-type Na+/H+ or K+/H+ antiporter